MTNIFLSVLAGSISVGLITVMLIALTPFINKRYAAKWKYWIWLFLAVRLLLPFSGTDIRTALQTLQQAKKQTTVQTQQSGTQVLPHEPARLQRVMVELPAQMTVPITVPSKGNSIQTTLLTATVMLWAAGALCFIGFHLISYMRYKRQLLKTGAVIRDNRILCQLMQLKQELAIRRSVLPIEAAAAASPMMLGFFHAVLVLPSTEYSAEELYFILKHELVHLKRGDVNMKLLLTAANAVHWFNPLIWLMRKEAAVDMELSCDERVTQGADLAQRKAYTETLLSTIHKQCTKRTVLSTQFYGGKKVMKKRFQNILRKNRKKNGVGILLFVILLTIGLGMTIGCTATSKPESEAPKQFGEKEELSNDTFVETEPFQQKEKVTADADVPDNVREETPTLTFSLEGEEYEVAAVIAEGNGYMIYLPDGEWYPSDFENWEDIDEEWKTCIYDAWTAWNNDDVRLWTVRMERRSYDEAQKELLDKGYALINDRMFRQDGETIYGVELKAAGTDTWGVCSRYPIDAQEGYGVQIHAIAGTFALSENGNGGE